MTQLNVEAYLARIGYAGPREPTLETLKGIHEAHAFHVPFENLDIARRVPILVEPRANFGKLVDEHRGGWCLEQNGTLALVLRELGFRVDIIGARVWSEGALGYPYSHMTLAVHLDEPWIADVGFGGRIVGPLRMAERGVQRYGMRGYVVANDGDHWFVTASEPGSGSMSYVFTLDACEIEAFQDANRWLQTSPDSRFTQGDIASLATPNGRISLGGRRLIVADGESREEQDVRDDERDEVLRRHFGIRL